MYRFATEDEKKQVKDLWELCFEDHDPYLGYYFNCFWRTQDALVAIKDNKVVSALHMIPRTLVWGGKILQCDYIAGVSTLPDYRGQCHAAELMRHSFDVSQSRKADASILVAAIDGYYEPMGYVSCFHHLTYSFAANQVPPPPREFTFRVATADDLPLILNLYNNFFRRFGVYVKRDHALFTHIVQSMACYDGGITLTYHDGQCVGYFVCAIEQAALHIYEFVYTTQTAIGSLFDFISVQNRPFNRVQIYSGYGDALLSHLYGHFVKIQLVPSVMVKPFTFSTDNLPQLFGNISGQNRQDNFLNLLG